MPKIAVLGAGVTGLSAALRLLQEGPPDTEVTIVARDFPAPAETFFLDTKASINYTSPWGGAHNRWVLWTDVNKDEAKIAERDHGFALATYRHMQKTTAAFPGSSGITFLPGIEYLEAPGPEYRRLRDDPEAVKKLGFEDPDLGLHFRFLDVSEVPDAHIQLAYTYRTWCVNPMVYLSFVLRRFTAAGGKIQKRELRDPAELLVGDDGFDLVVNCSGNGFHDENVFITRGQTCLVRNRCDATVTRQNKDGSWSFSVPRFFHGGTIIGGTKEPNDWTPTPSAAVREKLLANFAATYPPVLDSHGGRFDVVADVVGRRPTRKGGMRLDTEISTESQKPIVHAYGVGGRGYEISWGVAGAVVDLVKEALPVKNVAKL